MAERPRPAPRSPFIQREIERRDAPGRRPQPAAKRPAPTDEEQSAATEPPARRLSEESAETAVKALAADAARTGPPDVTGPRRAPHVGERQAGRFQARLTPSLHAAVETTEAAIEAKTSLTRNQIRQVAVWAILGDPSRDVLAFTERLLPAWQAAREHATRRARQQDQQQADRPRER